MHVCVHETQCACGSQRTTNVNQVSLSTMYFPGIELRTLGLAAGVLLPGSFIPTSLFP